MRSRKESPVSIPRTLREAFYLLVHQSGVAVDSLAEEVGVKPAYLYNTANLHLEEDGFHPQLRWLIALTRRTNNFIVLDFIEQQVGRVGVFLPTCQGAVEPATAENLPAYVCRLMKEIGDVARVSEQRLGDHDLSEEDRVRIRKEVQDVIQKAVQIDVALRGNGA